MDWDTRWHAITADGFYKSGVRRQDEETALWAWALKWNRNYRLVGFFGEPEPMERLSAQIPPLPMESLSAWEGGHLKMRTDAPLLDEEDRLFDRPEPCGAGPARADESGPSRPRRSRPL